MPDRMTDEDLAAAEAEAEQSQAEFLRLEYADLHSKTGERPDPAVIAAAKVKAEHDRLRVNVVRDQVARDKNAARVEAQHALGVRVNELAASAGPGDDQLADLRLMDEIARRVRSRTGQYDTTVTGLYDEATALHGDPRHDPVRRTGQLGPWVPHMPPQGIRYGNTEVHVIGGAVDQAIEAAVKGDVDQAVKLLTPVKDHTPPLPDYYLRDTVWNGIGIVPVYGQPDPRMRDMIRTGRLVRMTPEEAEKWRSTRQ